jgi:superfamily II DNA/RNA helicase
MTFSDLQLSEGVLRAISDAGYTTPTPIQTQAIPAILMGRDLVGCAQTGTGKTAGFTLPMIDILDAGRAKARMPRSLILEPTRELAAQVAEAFDTYGKYHTLNHALVIGGESMADQLRILDKGVDVLIATPGRLLDVFDRGRLLLNDVRILVIDEADRMLDMGFIPDVERIISLVSRNRQTLLFSATMPPAIRRLADAFLSNPKEITVARPSSPAETVDQALVVLAEDGGRGGTSLHGEKRAALRRLIDLEEPRNALIFCNRKRDVGVVQRSLVRHGYGADMLHGDMVQSARMDVLERFKRGEVRLLVCSDVAARGLDIEDLSHVFNFDVPINAEDYVHRIGRTGRAGRAGRSVTIAMPEDGALINDIENLIGRAIAVITVDGIETGELERQPVRGRRRRGSRSTRAAETAAPPSSASRAKPSAAARPKAPPQQPRSRPQPRQRAEPERPVIGMGEHVPAFMLRDVKLGKKSG